jgi:hypothetical protein
MTLTYWHSTLQGKSLAIHENDPQEGWYRTRPRKGYRSLPVRIWRDEGSGELLALRDGKIVDPYEVWTWVCLNPVSVEAYEEVLERGGRWSDDVGLGRKSEIDSAIAQEAVGHSRAIARRARNADAVRSAVKPVTHHTAPEIGHNSGAIHWRAGVETMADATPLNVQYGFSAGSAAGAEAASETNSSASPGAGSGAWSDRGADTGADTAPTLAQSLSAEITALRTEVTAWLSGVGAIADQVTADRCANYAEAFSDLEKRAEGLRTAQKKPVLDQGRAIDARWKPVVSAAEEAKRQCKKAIEPFLIAETERLELELLAQIQAENGDLSVLSSIPVSAKAGTFGRTISLRRVRKIVVSDRTALINHYHRDPRFLNDETVQKLLAKLAEHDLQAGVSVPGVQSMEEKIAA